MDVSLLGKQPIEEGKPAGSDVRYDPEFEALQAEMDKLSSPTASGEVSWEKVSDLCRSILSTKSKDLLVASYLCLAQIQIRQLEGLGLGLRVYRDLVENFWNELFPAKKRMKGRVAAIEWWLEKSEAALQRLELSPLPLETVDQYRQDLQAIEAVLREHIPQPPLLRPLERIIDRIPAQSGKDSPESPPLSRREAEAKPQPVPVSQPKQEAKRPQPAPSPQTKEGLSSAEAEKALRETLKTVQRMADIVNGNDPTDARPYRWRRIAAWAMIQAPPPATEGRTQIPPPAEQGALSNRLRDLQSKGDWAALLKQSEDKLPAAVLWLDLNRYAAEALAGLGDRYQAAHDAVCQETAAFIQRLREVTQLSYADGTPFVDAETRQWLQEISTQKDASEASEPLASGSEKQDNEIERTLGEAGTLARKKQLQEAVRLIQHKMQASPSGRERLQWRIGLARILMRSQATDFLAPHLDLILQDIEAYRLEEWDPDLALQGLKTAFLALNAGKGKEDSQAIITRIARLNPFEALQLSR